MRRNFGAFLCSPSTFFVIRLAGTDKTRTFRQYLRMSVVSNKRPRTPETAVSDSVAHKRSRADTPNSSPINNSPFSGLVEASVSSQHKNDFSTLYDRLSSVSYVFAEVTGKTFASQLASSEGLTKSLRIFSATAAITPVDVVSGKTHDKGLLDESIAAWSATPLYDKVAVPGAVRKRLLDISEQEQRLSAAGKLTESSHILWRLPVDKSLRPADPPMVVARTQGIEIPIPILPTKKLSWWGMNDPTPSIQPPLHRRDSGQAVVKRASSPDRRRTLDKYDDRPRDSRYRR